MFKRLSFVALSAVAFAAVAVAVPVERVSAASVVVYDSIIAPFPISFPSLAYQARSTGEYGDVVRLGAGSRQLQSVTVALGSFGCETSGGVDCVTTPGATFRHPLTLNIYNSDPTAVSGVGSLVTTLTQNFDIPYRPSADPSCTTLTQWRGSDGICRNSIGTSVTFEFPALPTVPDDLIWTLAFNTTTWGADPIGSPCVSNCAYDSLNLGVTTAADPTVGTDLDPTSIVHDSGFVGFYCTDPAPPAVGLGALQIDVGCWAPFRPMATIRTFVPDPEPPTPIPPTPTPTPAPTFNPVTPARVFDTRVGAPQGVRAVAKAKVVPGTPLEVKLTDLPDLVPATGVGAVSINVTSTQSLGDGFITVSPCGSTNVVSNVNFQEASDRANAVVTPVSATGAVCFTTSVATDIVVDLNGWLKTPPGFTSVTPTRVFDTRVGNPPHLRNVAKVKVGPGGPLEVKLTDLPSLVPATGVGVVSINVTSTQSLGDGFVTVSPCTTTDSVSSLNFQAGDDAANLVLARVSETGTVCFNASAPTDLIVDVNGWFATPSGFTSVNPARVVDTRPGTAALRDVPRTALVPRATLTVKLTDLPGLVPATGVGAVSINVTSTRSTADGFLTVSPCGSTNIVSNLNFQAGLDRANAVLSPISATGTVCVTSSAATDVVIDVNGWFSSTM